MIRFFVCYYSMKINIKVLSVFLIILCAFNVFFAFTLKADDVKANLSNNVPDKPATVPVDSSTTSVKNETYINGTVMDMNGKPMADVLIDIIDAETFQLINFSTTGETGTYKILVPAGKYVLNATPFSVQFNHQLYKDAVTLKDALTIEITPGNSVENINFKLVTHF